MKKKKIMTRYDLYIIESVILFVNWKEWETDFTWCCTHLHFYDVLSLILSTTCTNESFPFDIYNLCVW